MNLETRVFNGELDIAIFVVNSKHSFIFDDKENYIIDIRTIYKDYLEKEIISHNQYIQALKIYRGGASLLTKNNVFDYFDSLDISPRDKKWMVNYFIEGYDLNKLKNIYYFIESSLMSSNDIITLEDWNKLEGRLPRFYINLDRNIFMHTNWDREFENNLPQGWRGEASSRFWSLVPDEQSYWHIENMNFWKLYG